MGKCALIGKECPRTSNPEARLYCPLWSDEGILLKRDDGIPETRVENCQARVMFLAMRFTVQQTEQAAAEVGRFSNTLQGGFNRLVGAMTERRLLDEDDHR